MSKAITTTKNTLHTCEICGQGGFSASGLRSHQKTKTCVKRTKEKQLATVGQNEHLPEFDQARRYVSEIRELGRRAQHISLLLGFELNKQKAALGIKRGGDRKSEGSKPHRAVLIPWQQLVYEQTGLSADTCDRWMTIAKGASRHLPILMSKDVLEKPFIELPEQRQQEVLKVLHKAVDGQTMHQMMTGFGVWKDKDIKTPPKATKESAANRNANANSQTFTAEQLQQQAKDDINTLADMHLNGGWQHLDDADLSDLENKLTAYLTDISGLIKNRKGSAK